jgi:hypothetical protein
MTARFASIDPLLDVEVGSCGGVAADRRVLDGRRSAMADVDAAGAGTQPLAGDTAIHHNGVKGRCRCGCGCGCGWRIRIVD